MGGHFILIASPCWKMGGQLPPLPPPVPPPMTWRLLARYPRRIACRLPACYTRRSIYSSMLTALPVPITNSWFSRSLGHCFTCLRYIFKVIRSSFVDLISLMSLAHHVIYVKITVHFIETLYNGDTVVRDIKQQRSISHHYNRGTKCYQDSFPSFTLSWRIIIGSDRRPETKQGIEGKIARFRSGRVRVRNRVGYNWSPIWTRSPIWTEHRAKLNHLPTSCPFCSTV